MKNDPEAWVSLRLLSAWTMNKSSAFKKSWVGALQFATGSLAINCDN
jgi:hypothetical protein